MISRPIASLLPAILLFWNPVMADDWPQWRGPNRDAVWKEKGILETFPKEGPTILWRSKAAAGFSSPVLVKGHVYLSDATWQKPNVTEGVHSFDAKTGRKIWSFTSVTDAPSWFFQEGQPRGPGATPVVSLGKVFALGCFGRIYCLDASNGRCLWQKDLRKPYELDETTIDASPLLYKNLVIVFVGGKPGASVLAFDQRSGQEVWRSIDEPVSHSSPLLIHHQGNQQLVVWTRLSLHGLDPATGQVIWKEPLSTAVNASVMAVATPIHRENKLLVSGILFELKTASPGVNLLWPEGKSFTKSRLSSTSSPHWLGEAVYSANGSGELVCLDAATGATLWSTNAVTPITGGSTSMHMVQNGSTTFIFTNEGHLITARLSRNGYQELSRGKIVEPSWAFGRNRVAWAAPAFGNRCAFIRNDEELVCVSLKKP